MITQMESGTQDANRGPMTICIPNLVHFLSGLDHAIWDARRPTISFRFILVCSIKRFPASWNDHLPDAVVCWLQKLGFLRWLCVAHNHGKHDASIKRLLLQIALKRNVFIRLEARLDFWNPYLLYGRKNELIEQFSMFGSLGKDLLFKCTAKLLFNHRGQACILYILVAYVLQEDHFESVNISTREGSSSGSFVILDVLQTAWK